MYMIFVMTWRIFMACEKDDSLITPSKTQAVSEEPTTSMAEARIETTADVGAHASSDGNSPSTVEISVSYHPLAALRESIGPTLVRVQKTVSTSNKEQAILDALYEGPAESGLRFLSCGTTRAIWEGLDENIATVRLEGPCGGCGSLGLYESLTQTVLDLPHVDHLILLGPDGKNPGKDRRPACLEP